MTLRRGWAAVANPPEPESTRRSFWFAGGVASTAVLGIVAAVWLWPRACRASAVGAAAGRGARGDRRRSGRPAPDPRGRRRDNHRPFGRHAHRRRRPARRGRRGALQRAAPAARASVRRPRRGLSRRRGRHALRHLRAGHGRAGRRRGRNRRGLGVGHAAAARAPHPRRELAEPAARGEQRHVDGRPDRRATSAPGNAPVAAVAPAPAAPAAAAPSFVVPSFIAHARPQPSPQRRAVVARRDTWRASRRRRARPLDRGARRRRGRRCAAGAAALSQPRGPGERAGRGERRLRDRQSA